MDHIVYWLNWNHSKEIIMDTWIRWNQYTNRALIYIEIDRKQKNGHILTRMESLKGMNKSLTKWEGSKPTTQGRGLECNHALLQDPSKFSSWASLILFDYRVFLVFPIVPWTHRGWGVIHKGNTKDRGTAGYPRLTEESRDFCLKQKRCCVGCNRQDNRQSGMPACQSCQSRLQSLQSPACLEMAGLTCHCHS